jgi:hypothetical protein
MAAKKKTTAKTESATAPTRTVAASEDVASIEEPVRAPGPGSENEPTPTVDPTLSSDNRHSSYSASSLDFPPDQGNQVEEQPGKPKG